MPSSQETAERKFKQEWEDIIAFHRTLAHLSPDKQQQMRQLLSQSVDGLIPLLYDAAENKRNAHNAVNQHWKNIFTALDGFLQSLTDDERLTLKKEYLKILLDQEGKFESLVAAFPDLVTQKRFFTPQQFSLEEIHAGHLAYMVMGGLIKRSLDLFKSITGHAISVYDPDNIITRQYRQHGLR